MDRAKTDQARKEALNSFKDRELFRVDMKHIVEPGTSLADFSLALTQLAEVIAERSLKDCQSKLTKQYGFPRLANKKPCPFAILGAGKFGGRELGYASDIEVLFVYGGAGRTSGKQSIENSEYFERLAQELLQWIEAKQEGIFHLDVRLRPHGGKGFLSNPLDEITSYYSDKGLAAPFERQALIKLRHVAGVPALGKQVEAHRDRYVYSGAPWDLATALDLRRQQLKQLVERGTVNAKLSPGGVVDIEYAIQYLQIMHGHKHAALRTPNAMQALAGLIECGIVSRQDGEHLRKAYFFLRMLIDGLRMVRGHAKDLVLPTADSDEFIFLARRVGYTTDDWQAGARHLQSDIEEHMKKTREFFEKEYWEVVRFGRMRVRRLPRRLKPHGAIPLGHANSVRCYSRQRTFKHAQPSLRDRRPAPCEPSKSPADPNPPHLPGETVTSKLGGSIDIASRRESHPPHLPRREAYEQAWKEHFIVLGTN